MLKIAVKNLEYNIESYKRAVLLDESDRLKTISDLEQDKSDCETAILVLQNLSNSNNNPLVKGDVSGEFAAFKEYTKTYIGLYEWESFFKDFQRIAANYR